MTIDAEVWADPHLARSACAWAELAEANRRNGRPVLPKGTVRHLDRHGNEHPAFLAGCDECRIREAGRRNGDLPPVRSTRPCEIQSHHEGDQR